MGFFIIIAVIFFISPVLGAIVPLFAIPAYENKKDKAIVIFFFMALFLGVLNSLKKPASDLINYLDFYNDASQYNFFRYIFLLGKEPLFGVFNYITYLIFGDFSEGYVIFHSLVCYFLIFYSIWRMHRALNLGAYNLVLAIGVAALFPNLFSLSAHLMRQFLAASIIMYFLVEHIFYNKKGIVPFTIALFTHTTAAFTGLVYLPYLNKKPDFKKIAFGSVILIVIALAFFRYSAFFAGVFAGTPLQYLFERAADRTKGWQTENLGFLNFALQLFIVFVFYKVSYSRLAGEESRIHKLFYLSLMLFLFVAINYNDTEIALRFSFYMYFLFPFVMYFLPYIFFKNTDVTKIATIFLLLIFLGWFLYKINNGAWMYLNLESIMFLYGS